MNIIILLLLIIAIYLIIHAKYTSTDIKHKNNIPEDTRTSNTSTSNMIYEDIVDKNSEPGLTRSFQNDDSLLLGSLHSNVVPKSSDASNDIGTIYGKAPIRQNNPCIKYSEYRNLTIYPIPNSDFYIPNRYKNYEEIPGELFSSFRDILLDKV